MIIKKVGAVAQYISGGIKMELLKYRIGRAMELTNDYFNYMPESSLLLTIPDAPSNSIGEQAWCIVGARESYLKALERGAWAGFSCSLDNPSDKKKVMDSLAMTTNRVHDYLDSVNPDSISCSLVMDLLEHEVQHHGQLIRYGYANKLGFPESWTKRYTVR